MAQPKKADPLKAIAAAVKDKKDADGMVEVYPVGEDRVPNVPAIAQTVTAASAEEMLSFSPPAFTLYESGKPMAEHKDLADAQFKAAWGVSSTEDVPEVVSDMQPPFPPTEPAKEK